MYVFQTSAGSELCLAVCIGGSTTTHALIPNKAAEDYISGGGRKPAGYMRGIKKLICPPPQFISETEGAGSRDLHAGWHFQSQRQTVHFRRIGFYRVYGFRSPYRLTLPG